jgi:hypothetical protein
MLYALEDDIALWLVLGKLIGRKLTTWELAAIHTSASQQAGQFCDGNAIELFGEDMLYALLQVGNLLFKSFDKSLGYLAKEHTALATGIEERGVGILEQLLWEHINNLVCQFGRSEHLIVAQVGNAR